MHRFKRRKDSWSPMILWFSHILSPIFWNYTRVLSFLKILHSQFLKEKKNAYGIRSYCCFTAVCNCFIYISRLICILKFFIKTYTQIFHFSFIIEWKFTTITRSVKKGFLIFFIEVRQISSMNRELQCFKII